MRPIGVQTCVLIAMFVLLSGQSACADRSFRTLPAHWVDDDLRLEPRGIDFTFESLSFLTAKEGWIVGNRYLLQISNGAPRVTVIGRLLSASFNVVRAFEDGTAWAGGWEDDDAALWHYAGEWRRVTLPVRLPGAVMDIEFDNPQSGLALVLTGMGKSQRSVLLKYEMGAWTTVPMPLLSEREGKLRDMCFAVNGGWAVGYRRSESGGLRPLALRYQEGEWQETPLPEIPGGNVVLEHVVCDADGFAYAAGAVRHTERVGTYEHVLLRYTGRWERIGVPMPFPGREVDITTIALSSQGLWVAFTSIVGGALYTYHNDAWSILPFPSVEQGRTSGFSIHGLQIVSDEAWAIANDYDGPGIVRGLLFHYANGKWTNRNWNWSRWRYI